MGTSTGFSLAARPTGKQVRPPPARNSPDKGQRQMNTSSNRPSLPRVVLLGGAPLVGKSTVGRKLAAHFGFDYLSTDDLGLAARAVTKRSTHPGLHSMEENDYQEYYVTRSQAQLLAEAEASHAALWPALQDVIWAHTAWLPPVVLEGWALRPGAGGGAGREGVCGIWLVAEAGVFELRLRQDPSFWKGASDEEAMFSHFLARSQQFNDLMRRECTRLGQAVVEVSAAASADDVFAACLKVMAQQD